jgi:peptidoglycan/xylan/chitin deacetylase (PgdA/CDA1 family)
MRKIICLLFILSMILGCTTILKGNFPYKKRIILSFDDGPNGRSNTTLRVLDILKKYEIQAFFCIIGKHAENYPNIVKRIHAEGHILVNHSYNHDAIAFSSEKKIDEDIKKWEQAMCTILDKSNVTTKYYRPPAGILTNNLMNTLRKNNIILLPVSYFNFDSETSPDHSSKTIKKYITHLEKHSGGLIVLHDGHSRLHKVSEQSYGRTDKSANRSWVPGALEAIIIHFKASGYSFEIPDHRLTEDNWFY